MVVAPAIVVKANVEEHRMRIDRSNPDIGYLDPERLSELGVSQVVVAGDQVHWSGIVSTSGDDVESQLTLILATLDACLKSAGTDRTRVVMLTMFTTDMDGLSVALKTVYAPWAGEHRPALTCIGVARLAYPQLSLEVQGMALLPASLTSGR
jgi:enamine deaminase RidA (YjgF/YER057c/UK114 family)